jgi:hypothetical protein
MSPSSHEQRVPVLASHPDALKPGDHPGRAFQIDHSHAGFPQGFMTRRILSRSLSRCVLADECNRPNCQRVAVSSGGDIPDAGTALPDLNRLCFVPIHRYHRPVQGYRTAARPGRRLALVFNAATVILSQKTPRSTPLPKIFRGEWPAVFKWSRPTRTGKWPTRMMVPMLFTFLTKSIDLHSS